MSGASGRSFPRPRLLTLVYVTTLTFVAVASGIFVWLISDRVRDSAVDASARADQTLLRAFVQTSFLDSDFSFENGDPSRVPHLQGQLASLVGPADILRVKLWSPTATVILSDDPTLRGQRFELEDDLVEAFGGVVQAHITDGGEGEERASDALPADHVIEEYLPVHLNGTVPAVFEVYRDAAPILARVDATRRDFLLVMVAVLLLLAGLLRLIFKAASDRLRRQTKELVEATQRDGLTGLWNHGSIVSTLALQLERGRRENLGIAIGLVDIDNFRLLNDTNGHPAGDVAMRTVAEILREELSRETELGRFGPDEFLIVAPPQCAHDVEPAVERLRTRLAGMSLQFGVSEQLPVTVSAAVAYFPIHAESTTALLSVTTVALGEAKASGGDAVRMAHHAQDERRANEARSFDVLKGLVLAIDTKDRYTVRHSEDVARYATFLAKQLGLDEEELRTLRVAGLLHDIGKIGIPDAVLRKPAGLTANEYEIVKQHVSLGPLIVRDVTNLEQVRAGIRYHHERWDGQGYLDGLTGMEIPLIARILSVADAFSAMTTSRPYRKALDVREALHRLEDAAGSQLDPKLVLTFVSAIETAPDAPIPGFVRPAPGSWTLLEGVA